MGAIQTTQRNIDNDKQERENETDLIAVVAGLMFFAVTSQAVAVIAMVAFAATAEAAIKDYGQKEYVSVSKDLPCVEEQPWKLVCTMPYNCHFQPWIEVDVPEGKEIRFNSSNPLVQYLTKTETYTTAAGVQQVEAKKWVSGEGCIYMIPGGSHGTRGKVSRDGLRYDVCGIV